MTSRRGPFAVGPGELAGSVADLGVLVPLLAALILVNGIDATSALVGAGGLVLASGAWFRIPWPVQPLKALTAVAVARELSPDMIHAAGMLIGLVLLLLAFRGVADRIALVFTLPVVRALQVGVGTLLVLTALRLVQEPPAIFAATPPTPWPLLLGLAAVVVVAWAARHGRYLAALGMLAAGVAVVAFMAPPELARPDFALPVLDLPPLDHFGPAFVLLVLPQIPLTFGNAVVAVTDVAHRAFPDSRARVTPSRVARCEGLGNLLAGAFGGMPMCHGAGGLTAHHRLGARTAGMNMVLGSALLALGLFWGGQAPVLLGLLPVWGLAAFLAYAGMRHTLLSTDLHGVRFVLAAAAGLAGAALGNLAVTTVIALVADHGLRAAERRGLVGLGAA